LITFLRLRPNLLLHRLQEKPYCGAMIPTIRHERHDQSDAPYALTCCARAASGRQQPPRRAA
jgi:hypothetical protein